MKEKIEILAPGGDLDSIKAAIEAGAGAVYCGIHKFNARNRATNITFNDLNGILRLAHSKNCKVFLTLNIIIVDSEFPDLIRLLNKLVNTSIDGVIIQDMGLFHLLNKYFKSLDVHASTQLTTHNQGQVNFLQKLNASRVNLSRELNLDEIRDLSAHAHQKNLLSEVFVHGSYCISFSGQCYMSSLHGGNSGNRGRCSQPCRDRYEETANCKNFPLNLKDNSALPDIKDLAEAGVDSLKIEGRIKKYHYVFTVVDTYKKQLQRYYEGESMSLENSALYRVFNRDFSNGYLKGEMGKEMFIDNPRDHSARHRAEAKGEYGDGAIEDAEGSLYMEKGELRRSIKGRIDQLSIDPVPLRILASGKAGSPLELHIVTPESSFTVSSDNNLAARSGLTLDRSELQLRFKAINDTEFFIDNIDLEDLEPDLYLPFSDLSSMKKAILRKLRKGKNHIAPVKVPALNRAEASTATPTLSILLSSKKDLNAVRGSNANIYYQIPDAPSYDLNGLKSLFLQNRDMTPWFPSVLIGEEYKAAVKFMREVNPEQIVSDNTGLAYEAFKMGIPWIAGPRLNIVNSHGLHCLQERFSCSGAFLSNELKRQQLGAIRKPRDFMLYFSIYHPIDLMTSRLCLFQEVGGCSKEKVDASCLPGCCKSATLSRPGKGDFMIEKTEANYNRIYNDENYLNTEVLTDLPGLFDGFLMDLRGIKTRTRLETSALSLVGLFEDLMKGDPEAGQKIGRVLYPTSLSQYRTGI